MESRATSLIKLISERTAFSSASPPPTAVRTGTDANMDTAIRAQPIIYSTEKMSDTASYDMLFDIFFISEMTEITAAPAKQAAAI